MFSGKTNNGRWENRSSFSSMEWPWSCYRVGKEESRNYSLYVKYSYHVQWFALVPIEHTMLLRIQMKSLLWMKSYKYEYAPSSKKVS